MSLNESQLYFIRKAKGRKTRVLVAAINREIGQGNSAITKRIIKSRISKELRLHFRVERIADLQKEDYERVLEMIRSYRLFYCGKYFG